MEKEKSFSRKLVSHGLMDTSRMRNLKPGINHLGYVNSSFVKLIL